MRTDSRLSRMLHVLLHMARHDRPLTSEQIARMLDTHPVVVRRTMAGLRDAGYVRSGNGHGGGWTLARQLDDISLLDVHRAVGSPTLFAIGNDPADTRCAVARAVNDALDGVLSEAEALITKQLGAVALSSLQAPLGDHSREAPQKRPARRGSR